MMVLAADRSRSRVAIRIKGGRARVDFTGSAPQVRGPVNANYAITLSAVFYVMKCLGAAAVPPNEGLMRAVEVIAPPAAMVNANEPAAVAGGNVETSQRLVDVLFKALAQAAPDRIPAASSGSMSNLTVGGYDASRGRSFSYYETIAGGAGAAPGFPGVSGIHTHMTNTLNTPIEALEAYYPMRVTQYRIRRGSGGKGKFAGGDGLVRELECLVESNVSVLSERRVLAPYGLGGGGRGKARSQLRRQRRAAAQAARQGQRSPDAPANASGLKPRRRRVGQVITAAPRCSAPRTDRGAEWTTQAKNSRACTRRS